MVNKLNKLLLILICVFVLAAQAKDPTRPLMSGVGKTIQKTNNKTVSKQPLTAIFIRNKQTVAMIEGKLYSKGDYYRGSRILKIHKDKVLLRSIDGSFQLTLIPKIKK